MRNIVFIAMAIGFNAALLVKLPSLIRDPRSPFLRALIAVLALSGAAAIAGIPAVSTYLESTTGVMAVWVIVFVAAGGGAVRATHLLMLYPLAEARHRINSRLVYYAVAVAAIIVLCVMARGQVSPAEIARNEAAPETLWRKTPYVRDAYLVYGAIMGYTFLDAALRLARIAQVVVDRRRLRQAVWIQCLGMALLLTYTVLLAFYSLLYRFGVDLPGLQVLGTIASGLGGVAAAVGVAMPALIPRWDRLAAYRRLRPLWLSLGEVLPGAVLDRPGLPLLDAWNPVGSDFRLYRRVIEIRDGALALRPYIDPDVAVAARRLGHAAGQDASELDATVAAAQLKAAIEDKHRGRQPIDTQPAPLLLEGAGADLDSELRLLAPIAHAFATSEIVKMVALDARSLYQHAAAGHQPVREGNQGQINGL